MARCYLVRHGDTAWTREKRFQGQIDIPLSTEGQNQALTVARYLAKTRFDSAFSSDLSRALQTARVILGEQAEHAPELVISTDLREISDGNYEGWLISEMAKEDSRLVERTDNGAPAPDFAPPNGESVGQLYLRQRAVASLLRHKDEGAQVLVVGHGWALRALAAALAGEGAEGFWKRDSVPPASVSIIDYDQGSASIVTWGDAAHLATDKL